MTQLDGIRAVAIILVFAAHSISFESGWIGVDIFFVLSGYLITGILRRDRNNEKCFWAGFYLRRATRILPPLALCFAGTALLFTLDWHRLWYYYVFFAANVGETLYRGQSETLGVLWSLAVEEHFYLLWPLAVRFLTRKHLIWILALIVIGEPILRAASTPWTTSFWPIYFLTPFRLDGLAAGSLLAIMLERDRPGQWIRIHSCRFLCGSSLLLTVVFLCGGLSRSSNSALKNALDYSLVAFVSAWLIAHVVLHVNGLTARALSRFHLPFIGRISYGLYLFHGLALAFVTHVAINLFGWHHIRVLLPLTMFIAVSCAWASFRWYEEPLIRFGHRLIRRWQEP